MNDFAGPIFIGGSFSASQAMICSKCGAAILLGYAIPDRDGEALVDLHARWHTERESE